MTEVVKWTGIDPVEHFVSGETSFQKETEQKEKYEILKRDIEQKYPSLIRINPTTIKITGIYVNGEKQ